MHNINLLYFNVERYLRVRTLKLLHLLAFDVKNERETEREISVVE